MYSNFSNLTSPVLAELEACSFRRRTGPETLAHITPLLQKYLPLAANPPSGIVDDFLRAERQKDHYSHWILRLAFSRTPELRERFARVEKRLFELRFQNSDGKEKQAFVSSLDFDWETVSVEERAEFAEQLAAVVPRRSDLEDGSWFKVDWERVPELVQERKVYLRRGKAYVPAREQISMVVAEFATRLEKALEVSIIPLC